MDNFVVKREYVRPVLERAYCPDCGVELERDPVVLSTFPATFQYFCPKCGYGYRSHKSYPLIDYVNIDDDIES